MSFEEIYNCDFDRVWVCSKALFIIYVKALAIFNTCFLDFAGFVKSRELIWAEMDFDFKVSGDFIVSGAEQLDDTDLTRSDEFWLIQAPLGQVCLENDSLLQIWSSCNVLQLNDFSLSQFPEIEENTLKIEPEKDGLFGEFKDSNGMFMFCVLSYSLIF